ncbi:MAG TPA: DUF4255 domain-containing protein [Thermoanaerobaculia bacterium]|nr:DUF4255 domain-containing protein [Thermoanaerobaculia bacterium]
MSNGFAIAAVSATLRQLLLDGLQIGNVTVRPLDKARENIANDQVNLFLYHTQVDGGWRNMDMPRQLKPGESGHPPLPLTLFYLLTAYSDDTDEVKSHGLLGKAMGILHDHPMLDASEIQSATGANVPDSDLHEQLERVRITHQPLPLEEVSKLWSAFQTQYRTSVAYQVSVVLIESRRAAKAALPVLTRGKEDMGITSQADVLSPFPTLLDIELPGQQFSALLGDVVILKGHRLADGTPKVIVRNSHIPDPVPVVIEAGGTAKEIRFTVDDDPAKWVAGLYTVSVEVTGPDGVRTSNELPLTVAPRITSVLPLDVTRGADETAEITLSFSPRFRPGQRAALLVGDREVPATPVAAITDTLTFEMKKAPVGDPFIRLRIDGVDSLLVKRLEDKPPVFDETQKVIIHD